MKETDLLRRHFTLLPGTLIAGRLPISVNLRMDKVSDFEYAWDECQSGRAT
jgi:hypothetical protein